MAKLSAHGEELARINGLMVRYSVRSDGHILQNTGAGWKLCTKLKDRSILACRECAAGMLARQYRLAEERPAREAYKIALHGVAALKYRWEIDSRLGAPAYIDGNERAADWSSTYKYADRAPMPTAEEWDRLDRLYWAMKRESAKLAQPA